MPIPYGSGGAGVVLLRPRSSATFKAYMRGDFGTQLIREYLQKMRLLPSLGLDSQELAKDFFVLCIVQIGESWRRFCHKLQSFPYILWSLCELERPADLCMELAKFQRQARQCDQCVDPEFTAVLLGQLPSPIDPANPDHIQMALKIKQLLQDLSTFVPLSTDSVEALHGFSQSKLHRFRGSKPTDKTAKEICLWGKVVSAWNVVMKWIWDRTGDIHNGRRVAAFYNTSASKVGSSKPRRAKLTMPQVRAMAKDVEANPRRFKQKRLCGLLSAAAGVVGQWWQRNSRLQSDCLHCITGAAPWSI